MPFVPGIGHVKPFDDEALTVPAAGTVVTLNATKLAAAQWVEARLEGPNVRFRYNADPTPTVGTELLSYDLWKDVGAVARRLRLVIEDTTGSASVFRAIYFR